MSNFPFIVPDLNNKKCWLDLRGRYRGGYGWRGNLRSLNKVILHHTVTPRSGNAVKDCDMLANIHIRSNRWGGIGYHLLITSEVKDGYAVVAYVGDLKSARAHDFNGKGKSWSPHKQGNFYSVGISFIGNHQKDGLMVEQLRSAKLLLDELVYREDARIPNVKSYNDILGHGFSSYTWCPDGNQGYTLKNAILNVNFPKMSNELRQSAEAWDDLVASKKMVTQRYPKDFRDKLRELFSKNENERGSRITNSNDEVKKVFRDYVYQIHEVARQEGVPKGEAITMLLREIEVMENSSVIKD